MFAWDSFLGAAKDLADRGDEAGLRCAMSRAYYAAFCSARNHLRDRESVPTPRTGAAHRTVWDKFEEGPDGDRRLIGTLGVRLRRSRNKADYDDEVNPLADLTDDALADAEQVLELLQRYKNSETFRWSLCVR